MDPARKRHFLQRWDRRQLFVRDRIREHLHDVAVDARIDWLHHRDLNNRSTLDGTLSPRRVPINTSNNQLIIYLHAKKIMEEYLQVNNIVMSSHPESLLRN